MRLSKSETDRRHQAAVQFFQVHPEATADQFNERLMSGALTGQAERMMGSKSVYKARDLARAIVATAARGGIPIAEFKNARRPSSDASQCRGTDRNQDYP